MDETEREAETRFDMLLREMEQAQDAEILPAKLNEDPDHV